MSQALRIAVDEIPSIAYCQTRTSWHPVYNSITTSPPCVHEFTALLRCLEKNKHIPACTQKYRNLVVCLNKNGLK